MALELNRRAAAVSLVLGGAVALSLVPLAAPDPRSADALADVFSASRAMEHVAAIAREPHPGGSPEMGAVARYLTGELRELGIQVSNQRARGRGGVALRNTVGRIAGSSSTGAVLVVSHPDSVPYGPGAGDNASGAAVVLELARTLVHGPKLRNDVIVLFDDGEETGFEGGYAFARAHPWMKDVRLMVGIDTAAWGVPHPMQSSDDDGMLIRAYADGVDDPVAFSVITALTEGEFETQPFKEEGLPAIELEDNYAELDQHTERDTVDGVKPEYVQQMGDQVLGLVRASGDMDLAGTKEGSRVFHTFPVVGIVHYSAGWSVPLFLLAALGYAAVVLVAIRNAHVGGRGLVKALGLVLALVAATVVFAAIAALIYKAIFPNPNEHIGEYLRDSTAPFAIAVALMFTFAFAIAYRKLARRIGATEFGLGFLGVWLLFALAFATLAPAAAYYVEWPLLAACATWLWTLRRPSSAVLLAVPAAVAVFLAAPIVLIGFLGDGVDTMPPLAFSVALIAGLIASAVSWTAQDETR